MEKSEKNQRKELGKPEHLNKNCWLVKALNYTPYKRCQYCELKFRNCLFLHYQTVSLILVIIILSLSFLIEREIPALVVISIFALVIVYGYFFNKSTDKIIQANFTERKAKKDLEELTKNLQQKVAEQTKSLKELLSMKTEFLNTVSHQLRTPTTIFRSMLSMITEGDVSGKQKEEWIKDSYGAANRLLIIIESILEANTFEGKTPSFDFKLCDLEDVIQDAVSIFTNIAEKKGVILEYQRPKQELPQIMADAGWLRSAFVKLIDNAIWYTRENGRVIVKCQSSNNKV
ncbi:MAG: HAMP domain-containing sensor histidine kinase, partial [bacterium]